MSKWFRLEYSMKTQVKKISFALLGLLPLSIEVIQYRQTDPQKSLPVASFLLELIVLTVVAKALETAMRCSFSIQEMDQASLVIPLPLTAPQRVVVN